MATKNIPHKSKFRNDLTAEYVRSIFTYEPDTGRLIWNDRPDIRPCVNARWRGQSAGSRRQVKIDGVLYVKSRIIWLIKTGKWPPRYIDHKNVNVDDNRWKNFRLATFSENRCNVGPYRNNTSGYKGVSRRKNGRWMAQISHMGVKIFIGYFDTAEAAYDAYCDAAKKFHKRFARLR